MTKIKINVGRVKAGIAAKGMTTEVAAEEAGITQSLFKRILSEGQCTCFTIGKIARVLGIPVWELVDK